MNAREAQVAQGRLRHQLDRQGYRCPFSGATLDLRSAVLWVAGPSGGPMMALHEDAWDSVRLRILARAGGRSFRGRDLFPAAVPGQDRNWVRWRDLSPRDPPRAGTR